MVGGHSAESVAAAEAVNWHFKMKFLPVYLLVFGADWLQVDRIFTLYQKGLAEETVAHLFTTGFLAAAISASFIGSLADRYGRRAACLTFCVTYSVSCFTVLFDDIIILFLGRMLGGLSTTLMYSVFESWMVTEYHRQHLDDAGGSLSELFGIMTALNSVIAILAGLFAQFMSDFTGTQAAPFMTAVVCLVSAFLLISRRWSENYGDSAKFNALLPNVIPEKSGYQIILDDKRLWALCITSCFFEGSMYLWIFFKFPALRLTHELNGLGSDLPFGMIFAALMCAMMLGSLFFTWYSSLPRGPYVVGPSSLLMFALLLASSCFLIPVLYRDEASTFWCFCLFEFCCGIYFPTIGTLKEKIVDDGVRAKIYGITRIPLNLFVFFGLAFTQDGERHRDNMFMVLSGALLAAAAAVGTLLLG
ncbi:hypothetical protein BP5796_06346 [Coleophoma crateriformis]|uniref:Molybdate-anion transporter n=1 Tax=Coleophoma crateriformis TaxID=565419 RepID=A0A3D8RXD1_9HELO|nr:hypothetical protein BP5796_06346 [Coleophoma crateriformis]